MMTSVASGVAGPLPLRPSLRSGTEAIKRLGQHARLAGLLKCEELNITAIATRQRTVLSSLGSASVLRHADQGNVVETESKRYDKHYEESALLPAEVQDVFDYVDDHSQ